MTFTLKVYVEFANLQRNYPLLSHISFSRVIANSTTPVNLLYY